MRYSLEDIKRTAQGGWHSILPSFGIDQQYLRNRHGPCPACGGTDRFRFDDKDGHGTYYCGGGGNPTSGDGIALLSHATSLPFPDLLKELGEYLRVTPVDRRPPPKPSSTQNYAKEIWERVDREDSMVAFHPYAKRKDIRRAYGAGRAKVTGKLVGKDADCIVVPNRRLSGELIGVECINPEGAKQTFGKKGVLVLGTDDETNPNQPRLIVEGWASGVKAWDLLGDACIYITFGKGKGPQLLEYLCKRHEDRIFLLGEEIDE